MLAPNPRAGLVAGKLMFPGEVGGKLMLSEGRPPALPGPMRMGVSTSWEAMPVGKETRVVQNRTHFLARQQNTHLWWAYGLPVWAWQPQHWANERDLTFP